MLNKLLKGVPVLLLVLLLSLDATSQVRIGVRAGFNNTSIDYLEDLESIGGLTDIPGFQVSGVFEFNLGGAFAIQPELGFMRQGLDFTNPLDSANIYNFHTLFLDYFQVPLIGKASFGKGNIKPYLNFGPSIGYLIKAVDVEDLGGTNQEKELDLDDWEDVLNRLDLSLNIGGGLAFKIGPGNLLVDIRYDLPLNDFIDGVESQDFEALQGRDYNVSLAYLIKIGK